MYDCANINIFPQIITVVSTVYLLEQLLFPDHVHNCSQAWVVSTCECLACSRLQVGLKIHLSWTFLLFLTFIPEKEFYAIRMMTAYTTNMKLCVPDELGILQHILSGQEQIISNAVMS